MAVGVGDEREAGTKRNKQAKPARHGNSDKARRRIVAPDHWRIVSSGKWIFCNLLFMPLMNSNNVILPRWFISRSF